MGNTETVKNKKRQHQMKGESDFQCSPRGSCSAGEMPAENNTDNHQDDEATGAA